MRILKISAALAVSALPLATINAQVVASDPESVAMAVGKAGYLAKMQNDSFGDPQIATKMSGWNVTINFYGCTNNADCQSIQLSTGFDRTSPMDWKKANHWNSNRRFGSVSLDEDGDPFLTWDVILTEPVAQSIFATALETYDEAVGDFGLIAFEDQAEKNSESKVKTETSDAGDQS
ncbi:YbjN domain-containing protein [Sphingorhabdus sp. SMR4y]|uniref:YbjN domain-containing protein n=1 Tax=Sphingorhabdus sp. SMR4y TaxID=2584094 RepID=UPI000B5CB079|nr:YbjN domain-containing protein [Sphingorhabdus sp. SMR4y]ASK87630.1 putative bacterial sensory transduction regulator [Sphingorhabdus sp. SMR4y]